MSSVEVPFAGVTLAASGAVCSIGHSSEEIYWSVRAGLSRAQRTFLQGESGTIVAAPALPITKALEGVDRGLALLEPALDECLNSVGELLGSAHTAVYSVTELGLWVPRLRASPYHVALVAALQRKWAGFHGAAEELAKRKGVRIVKYPSGELPRYRAAGVAGLRAASRHLHEGHIDAALLVGVSSQCERATLECLDALKLSKSTRAPTGFVPSEAACVLVLLPASVDRGGVVVGHVSQRRTRSEEGRARALALAGALHATLKSAELPPSAIRECWTDFNGERWRADEWNIASLRSLAGAGYDIAPVHSAISTGDVGVATVPLLLSSARVAVAELKQPILVNVSGVDGRTAALLVSPKR